jgi:hypothetical protein
MSLLQVDPPELRFENVLPGSLYVMTFSVRNLSQIAQRIRISAPKSGLFALNYIPAGAVAPGLDLRAEIECQIPAELTDFIFTDKIVATMGNERFEIPISALKPHARIKFEKGLHFGNILLRQTVSKDVVFTNTSNIGGIMKLVTGRSSKLKLSTAKLDFKPKGEEGSTITVSFTIEGREVGIVREFVKVQMGGSLDEMHIDVSGQVIEQNLTLLTENQQGTLDVAQFGNIYFGESKVIQGILVNSGPLPLTFSIKYDDEEEAAAKEAGISSSSGDANAILDQFYMKSLVVSPLEGIVKPFSQVNISLTFRPVQAVPEKGFVQQHFKDYEEARLIQRLVKVECLDSLQSISLQLMGNAHVAAMGISPAVLRFGECPVNDRRDILMTLSNRAKLPLTFEFPVVATFKFQPLKGKLMPHENISVIASFLPPQLGQFKTKIPLSIGDGLKTYDIKVVGAAELIGGKKLLVTGTDKLPEDFVPKYKFVDPEEEAEARLEKRQAKEKKALEVEATLRTMLLPSSNKRKMFDLDEQPKPVQLSDLESDSLPPVINAASESDDLYGTGAPQISDLKDEIAKEQALVRQFNLEMYEMTRNHNKVYNDYLQQSHYQRELRHLAQEKRKLMERGAVDFADPFGVNMGMDRGLDEPQLRIPVADEPLWTTAAATAGATTAGATAPRKMPTDENRLIQKKYPASPATQAELRDCSRELSTDDLKLVSASHKKIDYGKVCVGSVTAKNFVVFNNLNHSLLVSIEDLDIELQQSRSLKQVIPTNCMAGFDICLSSRVVGKIKKTITWKVNDLHIFKVLILAEVVPIELVLNKSELLMEFPLESLKPTLTTEVIVTNPGNAVAEFLWGSVGAFTCDPEKGTIAPGKSSVVSITWDPLSGKRPEEELGLHITGGIDKVLKVRGVLKDTKGEFSEKRLSLGVMAVGTEKELVASIQNTGMHELVYFIQPLDSSLGIQLDPMEAMILPGESSEINVTVTPRAARNYDNTTIHVKIRGGKSISMKLAGSSIIPQIEIPQPNWVFGTVTMGSHLRMPFTLFNHSPITATLLLDLSAYEDFAPSMLHPIEEMDVATQENGPVPTLQEDDIGNSIMLFSRSQQSNNNDVTSAALTVSSSKKSSGKSSPKSSKKRRKVDNLWKITLMTNSTLEAELIFRPTNARKYSFRLPMTLFGIVEDRSMQRNVTATGVASVLRMSQTVVDFGDRVVARDPLARVSYYLETTITNTSNTGVSFRIVEGDETARNFDGSSVDLMAQKAQQQKHASDEGMVGAEPQQIYFVSPLSVDLAPGASTKIRVTFLPQQNVNYSKKLGFFHKDPSQSAVAASKEAQDPNERPYLSLLCVGSGVYPCMTFSQTHIQMPTVPLGYSSRAQFLVHNNGYAALEVRHRISPSITVPLEVMYPDGNTLGIMIDKVRVVVVAKSEAPISWSGKLEFYDNDGERFFVTLSGCADNCLLTNYSFVHDYSPEYGFVGVEEQPVQFLPQHQIQELKTWEIKRKEEQRRQRSLERQKLIEGSKNEADKTNQDDHKSGKKSVKIKENGSAEMAPNHGSPTSPALKKGGKSVKMLTSISSGSFESGENTGPSNFVEGIDLDRAISATGYAAIPEDAEAFFLMTWLNKTVCRRPFDTARYPECMFEHGGEAVVDCLEQMSGKKIPNLKGDPSGNGRSSSRRKSSHGDGGQGTTKRQSEKSKMIVAADKLVYKFQQVLSFLISNGALLAHINPIMLLNRPDYMLMQEYELIRDRSVRITPSVLMTRKEFWRENWLQTCSSAWLEVMYQAVKIFVLSRLSYREYSTLPGVVITSKESLPAPPLFGDSSDKNKLPIAGSSKVKKGDGKSKQGKADHFEDKKVPIPKELQASNVFTHGEAILLAWATYHLDHADNVPDDGTTAKKDDYLKMFGVNKRVYDLNTTFRDFFSFCKLIHSHVGVDITTKGEPLRGYTNIDRSRQEEFYAVLEDAMVQYHLDLDVPPEEILKSTRNILLFLLHFYLTLPHLVPKAKIDFTGILGEPIGKRIEIKNSAKKPLMYQVSLKGCEDFVPEAAQLLVPGESSTDFMVALNARFQHQVKGKLYFWNVREPAYAPGSTLCFQCVSDINGVKPVETVNKQLGVFDYDIFQLPVKNTHGKEITYSIRYEVRYCAKTIEDYVKKDGKAHSSSHNGKQSRRGQDIWEKLPLTKPTEEDEDDVGDMFKVLGLGVEESKSSKTGGNKLGGDDWDLENMCRQPFWINDEFVTIPKNGSKNVAVYLLPFTMGRYVCQISFYDAELGEFCYQINADVGLPRAVDKIDTAVLQGQASHLAVTFNAKNAPFEKAFTTLTDVRVKNANKKIKARSVLQNYMAAAVQREETGQAKFCIDFTAPFFQVRRHFPLVSEYLRWPSAHNGMKGNAVGGGVTAASATNSNAAKIKKPARTQLEILPQEPEEDNEREWLNRAIVNFEPARAGQYRSLAVIYPEDNPRDVRCIEFNILAKVPDAKMILEFNGPARKIYFQEIPVKNETDADWVLAVNIAGKGFASEKMLLVPAHGTSSLQVSYYPLCAGEIEGKLTLRNAETNDMFEYALIGVTDDPLAEQSLTYRCAARKKTTFAINLPSVAAIFQPRISHYSFGDEPVKFMVETDLPYTYVPDRPLEMRTNEDNLTQNLDFELTVNSPLGGKLVGSLTFTDMKSGASFWYAVTVTVTSPQEERTIEVVTTVRQGCAVDITLMNPIDEEITFDVTFEGEGLQGAGQYTLPSKSVMLKTDEATVPYELIYSPLLAGQYVGRVNFANEMVGELWYKLVMTAKPAPPIELSMMEAMLGTEVTVMVNVENPIGESVTFTVESTNSEHFYYAAGSGSSSKFTLAPFQSTAIPITFRPSSLGDIISAEVVLTNRKVGEMRYLCTGRGLLPGVISSMNIDGPLHEIVSQSIIFRNPFPRPVHIDVVLTDEKGKILDDATANNNNALPTGQLPLFSLLLRRKQDIVVGAKTVFHIPVAFSPPTMGVFNSLVTVRANNIQGHDLLWCYPVTGTAEVGQVHRWPKLTTSAKTSKVIDAILPLVGLPSATMNAVKTTEFAIGLDVEENLRTLVLRSFQIQALEIVPYSFFEDYSTDSRFQGTQEPDGLGLRCRIVFEPLRVFSTTVNISFVSKQRGKWRAKIDVGAEDPVPDDIIRLTAPVHGMDKVSFKLSNRFLGYSSFQAFFASHSSPHFTVEPKTGLLAPFDKNESTTFVVTFAPKEYGAIEQATLHILTDDAQWTYQVKGSYPEIVGPNAPNASPIKSKLFQPTAATLAGQRRK